MKNEVQIFNGLKIKEENGQVMFDAETAAIGLGISQFARSGNEVVRWERVNKYLGIPTSGDAIGRGDFITEPQFYRLAIKANNDTAERFQNWVTSEVLPSIRKTGSYQAEPQFRLPTNMAEMTQVVTAIAEESNKRIDDVDKRVTELAENEEIRSWERKTLLEIRKDKVRSYLVGIQDPVRYKEARTQLYRAISQDFKKYFMLPAYDALPRKAFEAGKDFMRNWTPDDWTRAAIAGMEIG